MLRIINMKLNYLREDRMTKAYILDAYVTSFLLKLNQCISLCKPMHTNCQ